MRNQKPNSGFTDKRTKVCLQPCFKFLKAKLLHRVCLLRLPLGSNLAGPGTHARTRGRQADKTIDLLFGERSDRRITATDSDHVIG